MSQRVTINLSKEFEERDPDEEDKKRKSQSQVERFEFPDPSLVTDVIENNRVVLFRKTNCAYSNMITGKLKQLEVAYTEVMVDGDDDSWRIQTAVLNITKRKSFPIFFVNTVLIGGPESFRKLIEEDKFLTMIKGPDYKQQFEYDIIVIGGGAGGLSAAIEAGEHGMKVVCVNYVTPSPAGSTYGVGGSRINVGCIPKKIWYTGSVLGQRMRDARAYGWPLEEELAHDWHALRKKIQAYISGLGEKYEQRLKASNVTYINSLAKFIGPHRIQATDKDGNAQELTSRYFILSTGGRPRYPNLPGCREYCISSDDIFTLRYPPGKTVVVGGTMTAVECAGYLAGLGYEVTLVVREVVMRGFDRGCVDLITKFMQLNPKLTLLMPCAPLKVEQVAAGDPPTLKFHGQMLTEDKAPVELFCNTVLMAVGREPNTADLGLDKVGVKLNPSTGKVIHKPDESTDCPYVYALGDILQNKPELTPSATHSGRYLARRLLGRSAKLTDYINIATVVFTPLEYGCVGLSEEAAVERFGEENVEVYHSFYLPLEWVLPNSPKSYCYAKLLCNRKDDERVVGFHVTGPNAGEITQGFTLALKAGMTKDQFNDAIGIHPTCAEIFTSLTITRRSGIAPDVEGC